MKIVTLFLALAANMFLATETIACVDFSCDKAVKTEISENSSFTDYVHDTLCEHETDGRSVNHIAQCCCIPVLVLSGMTDLPVFNNTSDKFGLPPDVERESLFLALVIRPPIV